MRNQLLLLFLILLGFTAKSQFSSIIQINDFQPGISEFKAFDLDGDSDLDLLLASSSNSQVVWYENLGNGTFGHQVVISTSAGGVHSIYACDLDGDGDNDIIYSKEGKKIVLYKNLGNGNFDSEHNIITSLTVVTRIDPVDLDGDGDLDILFSADEYIGGKVAWFENLGNGMFSERDAFDSISSYSAYYSLYSVDMDDDGDMDVLTGGGYDISWFENLGSGTFGSEEIIGPNSTQGLEGHKVYAADLDGDEDFDVVATSGNSFNKIAWYENLGSGTFGPEQIITSGIYVPKSVYASDIDGDGDMDLIAGSTANLALVWHENNGDGTFNSEQVISEQPNTYSVFAGDLDNDGLVDVLSTTSEEVAWHENSGNSNFVTHSMLDSVRLGHPKVVRTADLDGDGDSEVLSAFSGDISRIVWYDNVGGGNFGPKQTIPTLISLQDVYPADLDGDGDLDLLAGSNYDISWFENFGNGNFGHEPNIIINNMAVYVTSVHADDIDGDGDMDVFASSLLGRVFRFENLGGGDFGEENSIVLPEGQAQDVTTADMDGDGQIDVIIAAAGSAPSNNVAWFSNLGDGTFGSIQILNNSGAGSYAVYAADLDGDGDVDILATKSDDIVWYENFGGGIMSSSQIISENPEYFVDGSAVDVFASDLDNDGDLDIITGINTNNLRVAWHENLGEGSFGPQQVITKYPINMTSIFADDLDGDGDIDVLSSSFYDGRIAWYKNYLFSSTQIKGTVFYDMNQNGIHDSTDIGFNAVGIYSLPESDYTFSHTNGKYFMNFSDTSGLYSIIPESMPGWDLVTDSLSYTVNIDSDFDSLDSLDFGFYPDSIFTDLEISLTGGFPRCNTLVNYWIDINNQGTNLPSGVIHLQLDSSISFVSSFVQPDSIVGQDIYWGFDSLLFYSNSSVNLIVEMPDFNSIGNSLNSILSVYELDESNNIIYSINDTLNQQLVCAYDPNDKGVHPRGVGSEGYIAQDQTLEYLIRFQNTGNDTAITVTIKDQLDVDLDLITLDPIASSHPMQIHVEQNGEIEFKFDNIMLPDSNVDFLGSQGFVKYSIQPKIGLLPNTPITNKAEIYFDQNPAVITNTVLNTIECYNTLQPNVSFSPPYLLAGVSGFYEYQWYLNGEEIPGAIGNVFLPLLNGNYAVLVADTNDCERLSANYSFWGVGTDELQTTLTAGFPICDNLMNYWIDVKNQSAALSSGIIELRLDEGISYVSAAISPDSVIGLNVYWHYDSLLYYESISINLEMEVPPLIGISDTLSSILSTYEKEENGIIVYSNGDTLTQVVDCSFEPFDKSVAPKGLGSEGYISQDQQLEYLIRFQNTGNDTALTVTLKDQLNENLDWETFYPIASSHEMEIHVDQDGEVVFTYENIMLPDSNVDFLGSQGYVKYSILPKTDLLPNTPITNTAKIYFDQNPVIVSDTVLNTIECYDTPQPVITYTSPHLSCGVSGEYAFQWFYNGTEISGATGDTLTPVGEGDYYIVVADSNNCAKISNEYTHFYVGIDELTQLRSVVFPNPFSQSTTIVFSKNLNGNYDLLVYNILGQQVKQLNKIGGNEVTLFKSELGSGMFLSYLVNNRTGEKVFIAKLVVM